MDQGSVIFPVFVFLSTPQVWSSWEGRKGTTKMAEDEFPARQVGGHSEQIKFDWEQKRNVL